MVINATVRLNDGADWLGVERKKELDQGRSLGDPILEGNRM